MGCLNHNWDACICINCGEIKPIDSPDHNWDDCICSKCGTQKETNFDGHIWEVSSVFGIQQIFRCKKCGKYGVERYHKFS